jgi:cell division protein FtsQ
VTADRKPQVFFLWLLLGVAAGLAFSQSAYFTVRTVQVTGLRRLTPDEVLALGGLSLPANVFTLNPRAIAARLSEYPSVAKARAIRRFPAGLRLEIEEREAVGALRYGEHWLVFDGAGVPFAVRRTAEAGGLPAVVGLRPAPVRLGKPARGDDLRWVAAILGSLPPPLYRRLVQVEVGQGPTLALRLDNGALARLGSEDRLGEKLGLLQAILAEAEANRWSVGEIDLRRPDQPLLRKGGGRPGAAPEEDRR